MNAVTLVERVQTRRDHYQAWTGAAQDEQVMHDNEIAESELDWVVDQIQTLAGIEV